jgi:hypothetical protein
LISKDVIGIPKASRSGLDKLPKTVTVIPDEAKARSGIQENTGSFWIPDIRLRRLPE